MDDLEGRHPLEENEENVENTEELTQAVASISGVQQTNDPGEETESAGEEEGETITPAQLVTEITLAWQNEIAAPRLLPHKETIVDLMVDQIEAMEDNFSKCTDQTALKVMLHKMEVQRLAYMTSEYIRERLKKIERGVEMLLNEDAEREKTNAPGLLSTTEKAFAERYEKMKHQLIGTCFLERIPPALQRLPTVALDMSGERVIAEVTSDRVEQATFPDMGEPLSDQTVEMPPGSLHFIPYPSIAELLESNKVRLL